MFKFKVASALCKDYPVRYIVSRGTKLRYFFVGDGGEDLPGEELDMDQDDEEEPSRAD